MKRIIVFFHTAIAALTIFAETANELEYEEECEFDRFYISAGATIFLPQGGNGQRHLSGATGRVGWYMTEFWAIESEAAFLENSAGLSLSALWHWWGYERLDPFFTFGAKGWFGSQAENIGPKIGVGTFYHLTDSISLRFDADATLGLKGDEKMNYTISAGLQYSF
jgi:hypothetical protein